ncbi:ExbD/TolR family protein [Derxia gummosa]|uniref:ExbD/TolR family protein n=1 Tax=Derxia gummosa DSM 723 TaxID=1121388 RepID=A0A8B6X6Z9_9BURK|nr:biopolymer transporter ExbD [Derxia gummosa]
MARNHRGHYFGAEHGARIEIIPMIDVMMFLLVFFVLIMLEMIQGAGITLDLPQSTTAQQLETVKISIGVAKDGAIYLEGQPITDDALTARLRELAASKKVDVIISGDKNGAYQNIIKVMDLVRAAGISAIGLATAS